jgi:PPK2 family polyphosphate:nucleotide phosphotransferase
LSPLISLEKHPTGPDKSLNKDELKDKTKWLIDEIGDLQQRLYAQSRAALLVIFQGMDTAGKDGAIREVFSEVNPMGCHVIAFKKPTDLEFSHDFLWRIHQQAPPFGMIHVFNRSQYEDILVPTVEGYIDESIIAKRYHQINAFEKILNENGTGIVKFFLHISPEEQEVRLRERMTEPKKFWKHKDSDWDTRKKWKQYLSVYESILNRCNEVPWNVIPSDKNWYKEYLVADKVHEALKKINPEYPPLDTKMKF